MISSCRWDEHAHDIRLGRDPMASDTQSVWGYEENYGSFAQFTVVEDYQLHPKPENLSWEAAAAYMLTGATAYRQLTHFAPHNVQPGDPVLVWGGAGGLGCMAVQIVSSLGGRPVAVVSDDSKAEFARRLGERRNPRIVFEHSGESTVPTSVYVCDTEGMVVICGGTSGYNADVDLRFLWMRQKRLQGSHFANSRECAAITELVARGIVDPCLSTAAPFDQVGNLHQLMHDNEHPPGNMAVLVNATELGQRDIEI